MKKNSEAERQKHSASQIFLRVYREYLKDRGELVLGIAEEAGQKTLKIALRGLWKRYEPEPGEPQAFMDVVEMIRENPREMGILKSQGVLEIIVYNGEPYIVVDVEKAKKQLKQAKQQGE